MEASTSICRSCLARDAAIDVFSTEAELYIRELLALCVPIDPDVEGMPRRVCEACRGRLLDFQEFRTRAREADEALRTQLLTGGALPDHDYSVTRLVQPTEVPVEFERRRSSRQVQSNCRRKALLKKTKKAKRLAASESIHKKKPHNVSARTDYRTESSVVRDESGESDGGVSFSILTTHTDGDVLCSSPDPLEDNRDYSIGSVENRQQNEQNVLTVRPARRAQKKKRRLQEYVCEQCGHRAADRCSLRVHYRFHTGERPFPCTHCGKTFTISSNLKAHLRVHSGERPYVCEQCGRAFSAAASLRGHARTHTGERPYACASCPRTFTLRSNLRQHRRVHSGEKPYGCDICGRRFSSSSDARAHRRTHTGERPHACAACPRRFAHASNLRAHQRTHTAHAAPPHACALCGDLFTVKSALAAHARMHNPKKSTGADTLQHVCSSCGKRFARKCNLVAHTRKRKSCGVVKEEAPTNESAASVEETAAATNQSPALVQMPSQNIIVHSQQFIIDNKLAPHRTPITLVQIGGGAGVHSGAHVAQVQVCAESPRVVLPFRLLPISVLR